MDEEEITVTNISALKADVKEAYQGAPCPFTGQQKTAAEINWRTNTKLKGE